MRLLRVHPLDSPVVAMAVDIDGVDQDDGVLRVVAAVKFHAGAVIDSVEATPLNLVPGLPDFVGEAPIVGYGLSLAAAMLASAGVALARVGGTWASWRRWWCRVVAMRRLMRWRASLAWRSLRTIAQ